MLHVNKDLSRKCRLFKKTNVFSLWTTTIYSTFKRSSRYEGVVLPTVPRKHKFYSSV